MTPSQFRECLDALPASDWEAIVAGGRLLMIDDQRLAVGPAEAANAILHAGDETDAQRLRAHSLEDAEGVLSNYYRTHPLTQAGFTLQARALIERHGAEQFAGGFGPPPPRTLFVDGGEVLALDRADPRHRYGTFCEVAGGMDAAGRARRVRDWVEKGEAYHGYFGMNACRYNC